MADRPGHEQLEPEDPALAVAARHALHDEELIAAFATDGDEADDAERATTLIERCATCRDLHVDLVAIGAGLRTFGAAATAAATAAVQPAPRDFRLSVATANRLKPGSVVVRLRDRIREAIAAFSRPVGMSMASFGVVGLLLGVVTLGGLPGTAMAPADNGAVGGAGSAGSTNAPGGAETQATAELTGTSGSPRETTRMTSFRADSSDGSSDAPATTAPEGTDAVVGEAPTDLGGSGGSTLSTLLVLGSALLLVGGIALVLLGGRRREPIPGR